MNIPLVVDICIENGVDLDEKMKYICSFFNSLDLLL